MCPVLISFGPFKVYSYGVMIAIGLMVSFFIIKRNSKRLLLPAEQFIDLIIWTTCAGILGARIWYVIKYPNFFTDNIFSVFKIWEGGLILYGGLIGACIFVIIFSICIKKNILSLTDSIVPYFALVQGFGRIGCFLNGCCAGVKTDCVFGVTFPGMIHAVHPTQIYSALYCFLLAAVLFWVSGKRQICGELTAYYFLAYSVFRYFIEMIRANEIVFMGLTSAQVISIFIFIAGVIIFIFSRSKHARNCV